MKTQHSSNGEYIHKITDSPMVTKARLLQTGTSGLLHLQAVWPELTHLQCFLEIVLSKTLKTHGHNPDCLRIIYFNFPTRSQPSPSVFPTASLLKICRYIRPAPDFFSFFKQQPHSPMMDQINYFLKPVPAVTPYAPCFMLQPPPSHMLRWIQLLNTCSLPSDSGDGALLVQAARLLHKATISVILILAMRYHYSLHFLFLQLYFQKFTTFSCPLFNPYHSHPEMTMLPSRHLDKTSTPPYLQKCIVQRFAWFIMFSSGILFASILVGDYIFKECIIKRLRDKSMVDQ